MNATLQSVLTSPAFWVGVFAVIIIVWLIARLRNYFPKFFRSAKKQVTEVRESFTASTDVRLRNDIYRHAQKQHIAASLFSLDEIAIVPKVLTPLVQAAQSIELAPTDSVSLVVPYIPDWPEFGAIYKASTMTLVEALQGGANIILAGHPGSGKTTALAWLASTLARSQTGLATLDGLLPLYVHAQDIHHFLHYKPEDLASEEPSPGEKSSAVDHPRRSDDRFGGDAIEILIKAISPYVSGLTLPRLPSIIHSAIDRRRAILLLDGMDELPSNKAAALARFISSLQEQFPGLRMVVALSYEDLAGLPPLGFSLLGMAAWGEYERAQFLSLWSKQWAKWMYPAEKNQAKKITPTYLNSWLKVNNANLNPLEYVLKVWAAYSGDIRGTDGPSAIEAHIMRMTGRGGKAREKLEQYALGVILENVSIAVPVQEPEPPPAEPVVQANPLNPEVSAEPVTPVKSVSGRHVPIKIPSGMDELVENGFVVEYQGSHFQFSHPVFTGYLAGSALAGSDFANQLISLPPSIGKTLALQYLAYFGDVAPYINKLIQEDDILHSNHLMIARWLQVAPKNRPWRSIILRTLTVALQKEKDTLSLAAKFIAAIALSGDKGVEIYFRQLIKSDNVNLKQLAALGCGILADKKSIADLNEMLQDTSPGSIRAASLALAAIADKQSLEILATILLNGTELMRRCAAEALANDAVEGHPALKDGSTMEDLMVRRAAAFGLIRVNLPWATKIVENMQLEDSEWVVRNAAIQAFDELKRKSSYAPRPLTDLTEAQWLINYANRMGTTVAPGRPGEELVLKALGNGNQDEILNALDYLRIKCDPETVEHIYAAYTNNSGELKDIAYYILWLMMIAGIKLPVSIKYNIK